MRNVSPITTNGKVKKRVRLKAGLETATIFKENALVDSPRQIMSEKTSLGTDIPSSLFKSLESFYDEVAITSVSDRAAAERTAKTLMSTLLSKCTKLGRGMGFRFTRAVYAGSTMDGTQVVDTTNVDVFLVFELPIKTVRVPTLEPGYRMIPLRKILTDDTKKYDPWQFWPICGWSSFVSLTSKQKCVWSCGSFPSIQWRSAFRTVHIGRRKSSHKGKV